MYPVVGARPASLPSSSRFQHEFINQELLQNWLLHLRGPGRCPHDPLLPLLLTAQSSAQCSLFMTMTTVNTALTNVSQSLLDIYVQDQSVDSSQEIWISWLDVRLAVLQLLHLPVGHPGDRDVYLGVLHELGRSNALNGQANGCTMCTRSLGTLTSIKSKGRASASSSSGKTWILTKNVNTKCAVWRRSCTGPG